jgi:DNA topoisomerase-6 subunit B
VGTRVEIELKAKYQRGARSVDTYLRATALANPHVTLRFRDPTGVWTAYERATDVLPDEPREVKPHPYGVELGVFQQMLRSTDEKKLGGFLEKGFSRVSSRAAEEICALTTVTTKSWIKGLSTEDAQQVHAAMSQVKLMNPPTDCICPIGEGLLIDSLAREYPKAFLKAVTRSPSVYRGNPFQVEVALAYGEGIPADGTATVLRFANRVPLLYQQGACVITKAMNAVKWRSYGIQQPKGGSPQGPLVMVIHVASVWVPFTSESKEAVAHYQEIEEEVKRAVQDCGRALGRHVSSEKRMRDALKKRDYIARYIPKISEALQGILEFDDAERDRTTETLKTILDRSRNL